MPRQATPALIETSSVMSDSRQAATVLVLDCLKTPAATDIGDEGNSGKRFDYLGMSGVGGLCCGLRPAH